MLPPLSHLVFPEVACHRDDFGGYYCEKDQVWQHQHHLRNQEELWTGMVTNSMFSVCFLAF